jgi:hypothetical protein
MCTVGLVRWIASSTESSVTWGFFEPGSFGQPLPVVYVPLQPFAAFGGPSAFGLSAEGSARGQFPATEGLVAVVGGSDVEFLVPGIDPAISYVTGYRGDPSVAAYVRWSAAATSLGRILVLTGPDDPLRGADQSGQSFRLPDERIKNLFGRSHGAVVPVTSAAEHCRT